MIVNFSELSKLGTDAYRSELDRVRNGRLTIADLCARVHAVPSTIRNHMKSGLLKGELVRIAGKQIWLFSPEVADAYAARRDAYIADISARGRRATGGNKLARAPDGFVKLIDIAARADRSVSFLHNVAKRSGLALHRGPKRVLMLGEQDVPALLDLAQQHVVRAKRKALNFFGSPITWTSEMDAQLGKQSDTMLAGRFGFSATVVRKRRRSLGIAAYMAKPAKFEWSKAQDELFDKRPNRILAEMFGVSAGQVARRRKTLGAPQIRGRGKWTREAFDLLGKVPDVQIAKMIGTSNVTVGLMRAQLNIPRFFKSSSQSLAKQKEPVVMLTKPLSELLRPKIDRARPVVQAKLRAAGFDFAELTDTQIIAAALDALINATSATSDVSAEAQG